ncbi:MAG: mechanosensitive ion channel [Gammaproteobacteria bacterium]|nr:mechanosensitive ion channel [Gammaproteobacteria bacterium]
MYYMLSLMQALQDLLLGWLGNDRKGLVITNLVVIAVTVLFFWLLYVIILRLFRRLSTRVLSEDSRIQPLRIQDQDILSAGDVAKILDRTFMIASWFLRLLIVFSFLNTVLGLFDWTRSFAEQVAGMVKSTVTGLWHGFVTYLPDLFTALVIIGIAYLVVRLLRLVFEGVERQRIKLRGFYPEWSRTSFHLLRLLVIALTLVVVFPYLPGSSSPAFQGVSIFLGVLLSLGSTTAVANVVAGIVITYTRAFRLGDYVCIADTEGRIIERTAFATRIRTPKNVDVSLPNSAVLSDKVINYSSQAMSSGIRLHTGVTIGYDVPWPRVQKLLLEAASATEHIESDPAPYVLQTALEDNYVAYELNATTKEVGLRPKIYSDLHANILDSFRKGGVEITSPHYRAVRDGNASTIPVHEEPPPPEDTVAQPALEESDEAELSEPTLTGEQDEQPAEADETARPEEQDDRS